MDEKKSFEFIELKAMCMLSAAQAAVILAFPEQLQFKFKDEVEAREYLEKEVEKIIRMRWDDPNKIS